MIQKSLRYAFSYQTKLLINGKFVNAVKGKTFQTINPSTQTVITSLQEASTQDVDLAVKAARNAFDNGPWRKMSAYKRGQCMNRLADLIQKNYDQLAKLQSLDNGKPLCDSKAADLALVLKTYRYYSGWADKIHGQTIPIQGPFLCYTRKQPVGVCAQIIPWNFPLLMQAWKLGPALAAGCTVVMKTAEQTPLTALRMGELICEAGFPDGVVNILSGFGQVTGAHLAQHPLVDKVAFTGSTQVGYKIMRNSHKHNLKRITLQLGGKSPNIIMDDADLDLAVKQSQIGLYLNQGQCCIAGSRIFVHQNIYDAFVQKSVQASKARVVGDPFDQKTNQGPQVDKTQRDKVLGYIEKGKKEGAKILTGGSKVGNKGYFIEPTVFVDVKDQMAIAKQQIFGPVMTILKFKTIDEVIERANNTSYGLGAGVVTKSVDNALKISNAIRAGIVYVNCYDVFDANVPFGGFKDSGIGRQLAEHGLHNYLQNKAVIIKRPDDSIP